MKLDETTKNFRSKGHRYPVRVAPTFQHREQRMGYSRPNSEPRTGTFYLPISKYSFSIALTMYAGTWLD